jgi:N-acetylmuramoyl-L-alanine amidase
MRILTWAVLWLSLGMPAEAATPPRLAAAIEAPSAREAIARVAFAEAGNQGDSGLAGVIYTLLNRLGSGAWGGTVESVINAPGQFEPVMRAGGDWRGLRAVSAVERARIDTMLNLALDGRLPDPTGGALYFQNPRIVAARAAAGRVSTRLVAFGGAAPSAQIGDHAFYRHTAGAPPNGRQAPGARTQVGVSIIVPPQGARAASATGLERRAAPERGLFVRPDGEITEDLR